MSQTSARVEPHPIFHPGEQQRSPGAPDLEKNAQDDEED
jgi:hypothetical protein